jgi:hypothetical protein
VEDTLEHEVFWKIPNNYFAIMTAINRGVPLDSVEHGAPVYQNFLEFARITSGMVGRAPVGFNPPENNKAASNPKPKVIKGLPFGNAGKGLLGGLFSKNLSKK